MRFCLIPCVLVILFSTIVSAQINNLESEYSPPFSPGNEFSSFEKKRFKISQTDFDKPVSDFNLYFHIESKPSSGLSPMLDLIITRNRPCTDIQGLATSTNLVENRLDENTVRFVNSGQITPYMVLWQIRDQNGKVIRQWEPDFRDRLRCDGDKHFKTVYSLPENDLKNSFLLVYFEDIDDDKIRDDVVFEIDIRDIKWPNLKY